jgi:hypothetical protein
MKKNTFLIVAALLLFLLGIYMIYLGRKANIQPPVLTGIGFIIISFVFAGLRLK